MSNIYTDDNIHEVLEKVAGLPGYMKKQIGKEGLKSLRAGKDPITTGGAARKLYDTGAAHDARLHSYTHGRATAKAIAKARKSSGQERRVHLGDAASTRKSGEWEKKQFRKLVPKDIVRREKFKVASDENIQEALEKVAVGGALGRMASRVGSGKADRIARRSLAQFNKSQMGVPAPSRHERMMAAAKDFRKRKSPRGSAKPYTSPAVRSPTPSAGNLPQFRGGNAVKVASDDNIHTALEKVANVHMVKMYLRQGLSLTASVKKAYPGWSAAKRAALVKKLSSSR